MSGSGVVLDGIEVHDPMPRRGWYVLGRHDGGQWVVVHSRQSYEHIMTAWANSAGKWHKRLLVEFLQWGTPVIVRRSDH